MTITKEDVIWAYRMILGREPESEEVIRLHMGLADREALRAAMLASQEFQSKQKTIEFPEKWVSTDVHAGAFRMWLDLGDKYVSFGCLMDNYEPLESGFIARNVKPGQNVLDIGANIGWHMLGLRKAVGADGSVWAFEPRRPTLDYLQRTLADNDLSDSVTIHPFGLWDEPRSAQLAWTEKTTNPGGSYVDAEGTSGQSKIDIDLRALDSLNLPRTDFIKIDIEGAEPRALKGGARLIAAHKPLILSELHPDQLQNVSGVSAAEYIGYMKGFGYSCQLLEPGRIGETIDDYPSDLPRELTNVVFSTPEHEVSW
ncbi:FkbM family methyltransferase [Stappia taiwanensis]|uniref:FkbM family methyltransferase n=1 Tax=Stappia taiwanensis TaxID=992267 RepID=A0A838XK19_9HYPH|nr:FkbM family methyltransferase [Stappia taiwanensis]MBA4610885.1 FkbM family methyltransferase [Stappia taiwanensis]GGE95110.1 methyltransferase FkbM [Stappia taiwanensis]